MSSKAALSQAEDIWLSAESLERQLLFAGAGDEICSCVAEVVITARELHAALAGGSDEETR